MSNNFRETGNENMMQTRVASEDSLQFQVFFLTNDQSKSVEVLATDIIDFNEDSSTLNNGRISFN